MSKRLGPDLDGLDVEAELEHAFAELDSKIPDGVFETFSSKVAASLEREATMQTRRSDLSAPTPPPPAERQEHTGLHEIKALAETAQQRIRRRRTSESDVELAMLSSSSSALSAVVLPDPEASSQIEIAAPPETPIAAPAPVSTGLPAWIWAAGGTALVAAAIAAALFIFSRGGSADPEPTDTVAVADRAAEPTVTPAPSSPPPAAEPEPEPQPEPAAEPAVAPLPDDEAEPESELELEEDVSDRESARASKRERPERQRARRTERSRPKAATRKPDRGDVETRDEGGADRKEASGAGADIDALLDEVAGQAPEKKKPAEKVEEKTFDKKRLDSGDIRSAMGGVSGAVKACQKKTGFVGRVSVKFSVSPSGSVARVKASGASGPVHACVAGAVKRARFPSFQPPAMSFSYSFLLSD